MEKQLLNQAPKSRVASDLSSEEVTGQKLDVQKAELPRGLQSEGAVRAISRECARILAGTGRG